MRHLALCLVFSLAAAAAIVDGIVATVGRVVITDSMVRRSLRTAALLAKAPLDESPKAWEESRGRLIEQALVKEEIRISRYQVAQPDEVRNSMEQIRAQFGGPAAFAAKLREYRLAEADVAENVAWQITFSRFITYRFRPAVQMTDDALRAYHQKWRPAGEKPPFEAARDRLEAEFIAEESARYLDRWLNEVRQQTRIETLQPGGFKP
ncbi:MAG: hypothetical protein JNM66_16880 [Bryobacterales bacterium]|nr:hypothetical protein [Bryobacterales bacterium]